MGKDVFRYIVYGATEDEARRICEQYSAICKEQHRECRMWWAVGANAALSLLPDELPAVVAVRDHSEREVEVIWRGSAPSRDQLSEWAKAFSSRKEGGLRILEVALPEEQRAKLQAKFDVSLLRGRNSLRDGEDAL